MEEKCEKSVDNDDENLVQNFGGYTTVHGIGRIIDAKFVIQKVLWTSLFLGCWIFFLYEVYKLCVYFASYPVNTKVTLEYGSLPFPAVSFCNINPVAYSMVKTFPFLYNIINHTASDMNIDLRKFEAGLKSIKQDYILNDRTLDSYHMQMAPEAKQAFLLALGEVDDDTLMGMSQTFDNFVIQCKFNGAECQEDVFEEFRDEKYGYCYSFQPPVIPNVEIVGPQFGLELILNVNQKEYVPFVTEAAGVRMKIHSPNTYVLFADGHTLPIGFEIDVSISMTVHKRLKGYFAKCDTTDRYAEVLACIHDCIGFAIAKQCDCASEFWFVDPVRAPLLCHTIDDIACIKESTIHADCSRCKVPCTTISYKPSMSFSTWPSGNYEPILQSIVEDFNMNYTDIRNDLLLVRVYYSSLTKETIEEEEAYAVENLISDIGGQLGLWIGMSMLSVFEVIELFALLARKRRLKREASLRRNNEQKCEGNVRNVKSVSKSGFTIEDNRL